MVVWIERLILVVGMYAVIFAGWGVYLLADKFVKKVMNIDGGISSIVEERRIKQKYRDEELLLKKINMDRIYVEEYAGKAQVTDKTINKRRRVNNQFEETFDEYCEREETIKEAVIREYKVEPSEVTEVQSVFHTTSGGSIYFTSIYKVCVLGKNIHYKLSGPSNVVEKLKKEETLEVEAHNMHHNTQNTIATVWGELGPREKAELSNIIREVRFKK